MTMLGNGEVLSIGGGSVVELVLKVLSPVACRSSGAILSMSGP